MTFFNILWNNVTLAGHVKTFFDEDSLRQWAEFNNVGDRTEVWSRIVAIKESE